MRSRKGATLIEVLVAIFVMGIGLIALLTLFPLGALSMARAIQDDRCTSAVKNAMAIATMRNIRNDPLVHSPPWFTKYDVFKDAMPDQNRPLPADPNGSSYPVFVDPWGAKSALFGSPAQFWVCGNTAARGLVARAPTSFVSRRPIQFFNIETDLVHKWFALTDDFVFDSDEATGGQPTNFNPAGNPRVIRRDTRYSWAYLVQRPRSADASVATLSVVVFNKRPLSLTNSLALAESAYPAIYRPRTNTITITWSGAAPPNVGQGDWLLDCTVIQRPAPAGGQPSASAHGYFYRVVGITQTSPNSADYEVQQPIRGFNPPPPSWGTPQPNQPLPTSGPGTVMVIEGIADVYERGLDRKLD
jgi:type II secretory pathway pseudopilin PulG